MVKTRRGLTTLCAYIQNDRPSKLALIHTYIIIAAMHSYSFILVIGIFYDYDNMERSMCEMLQTQVLSSLRVCDARPLSCYTHTGMYMYFDSCLLEVEEQEVALLE